MSEVRRPHPAKLSYEQVQAIRQACAAGETQKSVAARYGVHSSTICTIVHRKRRTREVLLPTHEEMLEHAREYQLAWRKKNIDKVRTWSRLGQHALRTGGRVSAEEWASVLEAFDHRCAYCGVRDRLMIEHVTPLGSGGTHDVSNIVPACGSCNFVKGNRGPLAMVNRNFSLRAA